MLKIIKEIYNKPRTLISSANRETLNYIKSKIGNMKVLSFKTGSKVFGWTIPQEWSIKDACIWNIRGKKILDFKKELLSVVYYSTPVNKWISKKELKKYIYFDKNLKNAIPYVTSYYNPRWGFGQDSAGQFAREHRFKIYNDGRFYDVPADRLEEQDIVLGQGGEVAEGARKRLQAVLDTMPEFRMD